MPDRLHLMGLGAMITRRPPISDESGTSLTMDASERMTKKWHCQQGEKLQDDEKPYGWHQHKYINGKSTRLEKARRNRITSFQGTAVAKSNLSK